MRAIDHLTTRPWWPTTRDWGTIGITTLLGIIGILRHEWWRDEANPWLVARSCDGIFDLLHAIRFNGHPRLYYVLVYLVQSVADMPILLSFLNLSFLLGALAFFVKAAPLSPIQKLLFCVGFFPLYQYGVIARSYSLMLFLLFWYTWLKTQRPDRNVLRLMVLAILPQVHLLGLIATGALLLFEGLPLLRKPRTWSRAAWAAGVIVLVSMGLSVLQMMPTDTDISVVKPATYEEIVAGFANGFFPRFGIFENSVLQEWVGWFAFGLSLILFWGMWQTLTRYLLLIIGMVCMFSLVYPGHRWHFGFYFIFFMLCVWIAKEKSFADGLTRKFMTLLLALHALLGGYALATDIANPYSDGRQAAEALVTSGKAELPLVGLQRVSDTTWYFNIDFIQPVLLGLPGKEIWEPSQHRFEKSWSHYGAHENFYEPMDVTTLVRRLNEIAVMMQSDLAVVIAQDTNFPRFKPPAPLSVVAKLPTPFDFGENLTVCRYPLKNQTIQRILEATTSRQEDDR